MKILEKIKMLAKSHRGSLSVGGIIGLVITLVVVGAILSVGLDAINDATVYNNTSLGTAGFALWQLIPMFVAIAIVLGIVSYFRGRR